ncbi:MAG: Long-chain-fatty-acid--CoA ligase [Actinomycetota bacterium]|nr:Long-chain-fatty-acid--CoA ligase [Actinomycetota bacterium]
MRVVDLASRPDLLGAALNLGDVGGHFLYQGASGTVITPERLLEHWAGYFLIGVENDVPVARAISLPLAFPTEDRADLPDRGWDQAIQWAGLDIMEGRTPTALFAVEVVVAAHLRGTGLSGQMLRALKTRATEDDLSRLIVAVRPIDKEDEPDVPMTEYAPRRRGDGLLADRWMRTHERLGARMIQICPLAVTITGSLTDWHDWTGVTLADGENRVPGGIAPVYASVKHDYGVYVEANVWFEHPLW